MLVLQEIQKHIESITGVQSWLDVIPMERE